MKTYRRRRPGVQFLHNCHVYGGPKTLSVPHPSQALSLGAPSEFLSLPAPAHFLGKAGGLRSLETNEGRMAEQTLSLCLSFFIYIIKIIIVFIL